VLLALLTTLTLTAPTLNADGSPLSALAEIRIYLVSSDTPSFVLSAPEPGARLSVDIGYTILRRCFVATAVGVNGQESAQSNRACTRRFSCPVCHE
jgi:hypothetical protein